MCVSDSVCVYVCGGMGEHDVWCGRWMDGESFESCEEDVAFDRRLQKK